jgi:hypothetical protein
MGPNQSTSRQPLKPFRHFLPERFRHPRRGKALRAALNEETLEGTVTGASVIVIHSTSTNDERNAAIKEFFDDIKNMDGERIVAIALASDV